MLRLSHMSIRTRLLVTYMSVILVGFSILTLFAAFQIQTAVQADYEQHLKDEVRILAFNVRTINGKQELGQITSSEEQGLLQQLQTQPNAQVELYPPSPVMDAGGSPPDQKIAQAKAAMAIGGTKVSVAKNVAPGEALDTVIVRKSETGQEAFYTAIPIIANDKKVLGLLQLSVPTTDLSGIMMPYWIALGGGFLLLTLSTFLAALLLARSITRPLYQLRSSALRLSQGDLAHRITFTWADEIAEVAKAFNEMAQRLQKMLEEQRAFASNVSHELRTPLTAIRLRTEALRYDPAFISTPSHELSLTTSTSGASSKSRGTSSHLKDNREQALDLHALHQYIEEIDDEVVHLSTLVEELILLSQFEAGRAKIGQEQIDLTRMATTLLRQFSARAEACGIVLSLVPPVSPALVAANISHLTVIFNNLLDNALKYTSHPGHITWTITVEDDEAHCMIQDDGQGIAAQELPHLFERFYRVDKARSRAIPGTGLGLAIVKSIIDTYHGRILIESAGVDQGTTVHVYWPCQQLCDQEGDNQTGNP